MTQKALRFALEALDNLMYWDNGKPEYDEARDAITAIKEALANVATNDTSQECVDKTSESVHEPVACDCDSPAWCKQYKRCNRTMLGLMPYVAQRTWVEIDGDDWIKALELADFDKVAAFEFFEAKLKELNT